MSTQSKPERGNRAVPPCVDAPEGARFEFGGFIGERVDGMLENWLLPTPSANPAMIQMFRDRDRTPRRDLLPWSGEFAGKYLTSAVLAWRLTRDRRLREVLDRFVDALISVQDEDGYLGPHPCDQRLSGKTAGGGDLWDVWGHYHCMLGLLTWYREVGCEPALDACVRATDTIERHFYGSGRRVNAAGAEEMNMAVIHVFCLLYELTGEDRFLRLAREIERDWETPPAGDYVRAALKGQPFHETPKPRWESLHDIQAICELYFITGEEKYARAFEQIWWSILEGDRHNTGGFTSGERAVGDPYDPGAIETCCTVAWIAMSVDMLRRTGNALVADEIELATFNGMLGGQTPSGRWWTYNTPMDGVRKASAHEIVFQAREGSPELNCCSVNGPRGLGMIAEWGVMTSPEGPVVNFYGPCAIRVKSPSGAPVELTQETDYPRDGGIVLKLGLKEEERFILRLRIPSWSAESKAEVDGRAVEGVAPGTYLTLERTWRDGDTIRLTLDMSFHFWAGEREAAGRTSIYRGPILLAYDPRYNAMDPDDVPGLDARSLTCEPAEWAGDLPPWILLRFRATDGRDLLLCDFASAGAVGTYYRSWLPISGVQPAPFDRTRPVWIARP